MTPGEITRLAILGRLNRSPSHGYAIVKVLTERGLANGTTGAVYRALRDMADQGLVHSYWDTPTAGPARRTYELTPAGERYLRPARLSLAQYKAALVDIQRDMQVRS